MNMERTQLQKRSVDNTLTAAEKVSLQAWENAQHPSKNEVVLSAKLTDGEIVSLGKWLKTNLKNLDNADQRLYQSV